MELLYKIIHILGLHKPVDVIVKTRTGKDCDAYYLPRYSDKTGKLVGHKIVIYSRNTTRPFNVLLAHELIHAWQEEQRLAEFHGTGFQQKARELEELLGLSEIYLAEIDK